MRYYAKNALVSVFIYNVFCRTGVQENIDMIKLQREVKEKSTKFLMLQEKYSMLEEVGIVEC